MAVNKLIDKNLPQDQQTLLDLTQDTVTVQSLATGFTAHNSAGDLIVGTYAPLKGDAGGYYTVSLRQSEDWKSVIVSFTPSADDMDEIDDFTINLPNQSAYDIWEKQPENKGKPEAEFLAAIKGEKGDLPQKGVDYFTDEEKTDFAIEVESMVEVNDIVSITIEEVKG